MNSFDQAKQHFLSGLAHLEAGRLPEAERGFEAALALMPGRVSVLTNLGAVRVQLGKPVEALGVLEQATQAEAANLEAWSWLALAQAQLGRPGQALVCCDRALALNAASAPLWLQRAQALVRLGRPQEALASFDRVLVLDPQSAEAWSHRGTLLRELQRLPEAAECFEKALALGADAEVHRYFLASVRGEAAPANAPRGYVEFLFDDYAADFQGHLVGQLHYQGHEFLVQQLQRFAPGRFASVLDLGCGTGLCGPLVRPLADRLDGLDLSSGMLEQARALGCYDALIHADAADYLAQADRSDDLVLAADVFIYIGELSAVFAGVARVLRPGGVFGFTVEQASGLGEDRGAQGLELLSSLRYAHSEAYVRRLAGAHGFEVLGLEQAPLREDQRRPVQGLYVYLQRHGAAADTGLSSPAP